MFPQSFKYSWGSKRAEFYDKTLGHRYYLVDQLPLEVVSSLFLEASKQRMGDHLGIPVACKPCPSLPGCIGRSCLGWARISVLPSRTGRYSLQVRSVLRDAKRGIANRGCRLANPSTWITGCLERPVGHLPLRPDHLGLSRPGADSGREFLKLELMRTGREGCLGAGGRAQQSGPSAVSCLEGMTSSLPSTACVSTPLLSVLLGGGTDRPA